MEGDGKIVGQQTSEIRKVKKLYPYQEEAVERIFKRLEEMPNGENLLFQLPTGGGKTVIFTQIARQYIETYNKKVLILTHRVELLAQTSSSLSEIGITNKIISSEVRDIENHEQYQCYTAMVETLNNRLSSDEDFLFGVGLVIVDEAHYNSFRKLFRHFGGVNILGVTATPLSSNKNLPLNHNYQHLIVGQSISALIDKGYLAKPETFTFDVNLKGLRIGITGDFTVSSSERVYGSDEMLSRLMHAYEQKAKGTKTLIFNSGIATSWRVYQTFKQDDYPIRHLDSTFGQKERRETLDWFRNTPNAILTSVGILTTGFDEPTVQTVVLNRATRSLTLYHQMVGRGSRILPNKKDFAIIDLGNNGLRLGAWDDHIDWYSVFRYPDNFLNQLVEREAELDLDVVYEMPEEVAARFPKSEGLDFDIESAYDNCIRSGLKTSLVMSMSMEDHFQNITDNAMEYEEAMELLLLLEGDIAHRMRRYTKCISKSTENYFQWLKETYNRRLRDKLRVAYLM